MSNYYLTVEPKGRQAAVHQALLGVVKHGPDWDPFDESCKWHDVRDDLRAVSIVHPMVLIAIQCDGEEQGDQWVMYARAGQIVTHERGEWVPPDPPAGFVPE